MFIVVWREGTTVRHSGWYEDNKVATKYACRKIIAGYDAVVLTKFEYDTLSTRGEL